MPEIYDKVCKRDGLHSIQMTRIGLKLKGNSKECGWAGYLPARPPTLSPSLPSFLLLAFLIPCKYREGFRQRIEGKQLIASRKGKFKTMTMFMCPLISFI